MKKKLFFLPLVAALVLTGCSSEEPEKPAPVVGEDGGYIAVNIVAPADMGGRGDSSDPTFADTEPLVTSGESRVDVAYFIFFDDRGNQTQIPQEVELTMTGSGSVSPAVENISETVVVLAGGTKPSKMLVILNPHASVIEYAGKTLEEFRGRIADYTYNGGVPDKALEKPFIMTNSTYCDESGNIVEATDIKDYVYDSKSTAEQTPVQVYVERVIAKVRTNALSADFVKKKEDGSDVSIPVGALGDNAHVAEDVVIKPVIEGIEIANVANTSYLFKNIQNSYGRISDWKTTWTGVNDADNKRCYWANSTPDLEVSNQSWTAIQNTKTDVAHTFYVQENTVGGKKSAVLLTATINKKKSDGTWEPFDFLWYAGHYYEKEGFLSNYESVLKVAGFVIRKQHADGSAVTFTYEPISASRLAWIEDRASAKAIEKLSGYETTAYVKNTTLEANQVLGRYDVNGNFKSLDESNNPYGWDDVNAVLMQKANRVWHWNGGKCYYFAEIEHWGPDDTMFATGIVRNHIYDLTLNSLSGLGTPVADPDEIIIPEKPEKELYQLDARVNILKWRVVKQTVNFKDAE